MSLRPAVLRPFSTFVLLVLAACIGNMPTTDSAEGPSTAKGGPNAPPPVFAHLLWDDALVVDIDGVPTPAGIVGDGRSADGSPGPSAVQGNLCGVNARIWAGNNESGDMIFDEYTSTGCGALRVHSFYFDGRSAAAHVVATKTNARALWKLGPDESRTDQFEGFHVEIPNCGVLMYDATLAGSSNPRRTRLPDLPNGARQWRVESQAPHRGACTYTSKGKTVVTLMGVMPWAFTVTEVK